MGLWFHESRGVIKRGTDLDVEQVELDWVSGINVLVRIKELPPQQQHLHLLHTLLSQRSAVVQPVH